MGWSWFVWVCLVWFDLDCGLIWVWVDWVDLGMWVWVDRVDLGACGGVEVWRHGDDGVLIGVDFSLCGLIGIG